MDNEHAKLTVRLNAQPLLAFIDMVNAARRTRHVDFALPSVGTLARLEQRGTEITVYPSDAFLTFGAEVMVVPAHSFAEHGPAHVCMQVEAAPFARSLGLDQIRERFNSEWAERQLLPGGQCCFDVASGLRESCDHLCRVRIDRRGPNAVVKRLGDPEPVRGETACRQANEQ